MSRCFSVLSHACACAGVRDCSESLHVVRSAVYTSHVHSSSSQACQPALAFCLCTLASRRVHPVHAKNGAWRVRRAATSW